MCGPVWDQGDYKFKLIEYLIVFHRVHAMDKIVGTMNKLET